MNNYFRLIIGICVFSRETLRVVFGVAYSARMMMVVEVTQLHKHLSAVNACQMKFQRSTTNIFMAMTTDMPVDL